MYYQTRWRSDEWRDINELIPFIETAYVVYAVRQLISKMVQPPVSANPSSQYRVVMPPLPVAWGLLWSSRISPGRRL
jgi:hypothetical protein